jgi:hypothetical protein
MSTTTRTGAGGPVRLEHIDGLRALAALYVVVHHIFLYMPDGSLTGVFFLVGERPFIGPPGGRLSRERRSEEPEAAAAA